MVSPPDKKQLKSGWNGFSFIVVVTVGLFLFFYVFLRIAPKAFALFWLWIAMMSLSASVMNLWFTLRDGRASFKEATAIWAVVAVFILLMGGYDYINDTVTEIMSMDR